MVTGTRIEPFAYIAFDISNELSILNFTRCTDIFVENTAPEFLLATTRFILLVPSVK